MPTQTEYAYGNYLETDLLLVVDTNIDAKRKGDKLMYEMNGMKTRQPGFFNADTFRCIIQVINLLSIIIFPRF